MQYKSSKYKYGIFSQSLIKNIKNRIFIRVKYPNNKYIYLQD